MRKVAVKGKQRWKSWEKCLVKTQIKTENLFIYLFTNHKKKIKEACYLVSQIRGLLTQMQIFFNLFVIAKKICEMLIYQ